MKTQRHTTSRIWRHGLMAALCIGALAGTARAERISASDLPGGALPAVQAVAPVYRLFGADRLPPSAALHSRQPFHGDVSWHCKHGPHSISREDWAVFLANAKRIFCSPSPS